MTWLGLASEAADLDDVAIGWSASVDCGFIAIEGLGGKAYEG